MRLAGEHRLAAAIIADHRLRHAAAQPKKKGTDTGGDFAAEMKRQGMSDAGIRSFQE